MSGCQDRTPNSQRGFCGLAVFRWPVQAAPRAGPAARLRRRRRQLRRFLRRQLRRQRTEARSRKILLLMIEILHDPIYTMLPYFLGFRYMKLLYQSPRKYGKSCRISGINSWLGLRHKQPALGSSSVLVKAAGHLEG